MALTRAQFVTLGAATTAAALTGRRGARAADAKHYSFGYDQPRTTAYGVGADLFAARLAELSKGTMVIDQFPGAQLGQEPVLQKIRTGDIDFILAPRRIRQRCHRSQVCWRSTSCSHRGPSVRAVATPALVDAVRAMFADTVRTPIADAGTIGLRNLAKGPPHRRRQEREDRVQATPTEDTMFPAYGAQIVHMVRLGYTSLQTGVVDMAGRRQRLRQQQHYEVAPSCR
jgi:hypothetical protein